MCAIHFRIKLQPQPKYNKKIYFFSDECILYTYNPYTTVLTDSFVVFVINLCISITGRTDDWRTRKAVMQNQNFKRDFEKSNSNDRNDET